MMFIVVGMLLMLLQDRRRIKEEYSMEKENVFESLGTEAHFKCRFFSDTMCGPCVIYITGVFMDDEGQKIYEALRGKGYENLIFCEMQVEDWDRLLTPWPVENCVKGRHFEGQGEVLSEEIRGKLLPYIRTRYPNAGEMYIAGYSLAGLFSMWALYETALFDGAVSCSGSLWYPGWAVYMEEHRLRKSARVYLSLGTNEERTKHPFMKAVGTATRQQYAHLQKDPLAREVILEWNEGGHFADSTGRMVKGIAWMMGKSV